MTDLDTITPEILEQALRSLRQAEDPPAALLDLRLLNLGGPSSRAERILRLEDYLRSIVVKALTDQRKVQGLAVKHRAPSLRQEWLDAIAGDYRAGSAELEAWSALYHRYLAPVSFSVEELAGGAGVVTQQFRRRLNQGLKHLSAAVRREEMKATQRQPERLLRRVPIPEFGRLVGFDAIIEQVNNLLVEPVGAPLLSIEGVGGCGKTALATAVAHQRAAVGGLTDILWVCRPAEPVQPLPLNQKSSGEPSSCSVDLILDALGSQLSMPDLANLDLWEKILKLRPVLMNSPYLVVIDHIGARTNLPQLVNAFANLARESHVLLLSRVSLHRYSNVQIFRVPELEPKWIKVIIEEELARRGYQFSMTDEDYDRVYKMIGGNPLINKLVASHIGRFSLEDVFSAIRLAQGHAALAFYERIFKDTWQSLSESSKNLAYRLREYKGLPVSLAGMIETMGLPVANLSYSFGELADNYLIECRQEEKTLCYCLTRLASLLMESGMLEGW